MSKEKININKITIELSQPANCKSEHDGHEIIEVTVDSSLFVEPNEYFLILKSETGWSVDGINEMQDLFSKIQTIVKTLNK